MKIEERLDEIGTELGIPPRTVGMTMEDWFRRMDDYCATVSWSSNEWQLIKEMFRLRRELRTQKRSRKPEGPS
jgi:hypothetical protein